jgi:hypothetical protein
VLGLVNAFVDLRQGEAKLEIVYLLTDVSALGNVHTLNILGVVNE